MELEYIAPTIFVAIPFLILIGGISVVTIKVLIRIAKKI